MFDSSLLNLLGRLFKRSFSSFWNLCSSWFFLCSSQCSFCFSSLVSISFSVGLFLLALQHNFLAWLRTSSTLLHLSNHYCRSTFGVVSSVTFAALFTASLIHVQEYSTSSHCSIVPSRLLIWSLYACLWIRVGSRSFPISHFIVEVVFSFLVLVICSITLGCTKKWSISPYIPLRLLTSMILFPFLALIRIWSIWFLVIM